MNRFVQAISLLITLFSASAHAQNIPPSAAMLLETAGKWTIEYQDWQCVLSRDYLMDGKPAHLVLTLEPLTATTWMRLASEEIGDRRDGGEDAVIIIDEQRRPGSFHYNIFREDKHRIREYMLDLGKHPIGEARNSIRLWTRKHGDIAIPVEGFPAAWKAVNACMTDLYASFGIDEAQVKALAKEPQGEVTAFLPFSVGTGNMDFAFLYWINIEGRVDACRLVLPSGISEFDQTLCPFLQGKAKFNPARDAAGNAIRVPRFEHLRIRTQTMTGSLR